MRAGLGWRAELGAGILANLDRIDVVEVMAEDFFGADAAQQRALRFLRAQVPVVVHATSLGLASTERVEKRRLDSVARVVEWLEPDFWSEHLAFVRAGATEIGHLAAPPRNAATLEGLMRNAEEARRVVGSSPLLENVATLIDPPLSTYSESEWLRAVLDATSCDLLLDLHNAHANATNFGFDARVLIGELPTDRVRAVHLAGGRRIEGERILDDHLHDVPDPVYELLALVDGDPTVILERDGNYPSMESLLSQLQRARDCVRFTRPQAAPPLEHRPRASAPLNFLAALYTNRDVRQRFIADPFATAIGAGLSLDEANALSAMNPLDLTLAARSVERKRTHVRPSILEK